MNDSAKTPEVNNETTSEDGETTSVVETVKSLVKKNKKAIITVAIVATGLFLAKGQYATETFEDFEPSPDPVPEAQKRQSPSLHDVAGHLMKTNGQPSKKAKAAFAEARAAGLAAEDELAPGYTYRRQHARGAA